MKSRGNQAALKALKLILGIKEDREILIHDLTLQTALTEIILMCAKEDNSLTS
jgi:hypothetical protein